MNVLNDEAFSDRILHIQIVADDSDINSERNSSNKKQKIENLEEKGDCVANDRDLRGSTDVKVKTLHISSALLATKSPFFYKLFKNGMKESQESVVSLRINASEEVALMDVLNFMYSGALSGSTAEELLSVLMIADKFEVSSCIGYCCEKLKGMTTCLEIALLYLELPSSILECAAFEPLLYSAQALIVDRYKDVLESYTSRPDAMTLPLSAVELILGSRSLQVKSEDEVYEFIFLWGRTRYPKPEERREILTNLLGRFLHFPSLTMSKLNQIRECPEFDTNEVSKLITNSLYLNSAAYGQRYHFPADTGRRSIHRDYEDLPVKAVQLDSSYVVFWSLKKKAILDLLESNDKLYSQSFLLEGVLFAFCVSPEDMADEDDNSVDEGDCVGLFVERRDEGEESFLLKYDPKVVGWSSEFVSVLKDGNSTVTRFWRAWLTNLFEVSKYVRDVVVHIRVDFTVVKSQA